MIEQMSLAVAEKTVNQFTNNIFANISPYKVKIDDGFDNILYAVGISAYQGIFVSLRDQDMNFDTYPTDKKIVCVYPHFDGKRISKNKHAKITIFFINDDEVNSFEFARGVSPTIHSETVSSEDTTAVSEATDDVVEEKNIIPEPITVRTWTDYFINISDEHKSFLVSTFEGWVIAEIKNEHKFVISKKTYHLDISEGLFEKKYKWDGNTDEYIVTHQPVTANISTLMYDFLRISKDIPLHSLLDFGTLISNIIPRKR